jgi:tetratricopeptide (TPR) repeat protein
MSSEDYIIRMIRQATAVLARIIGLKNTGQYQEALQNIDQALEGLLGRNADLIRLLDDNSLYSLLMKDDALDVEKLELIADFFREEGDILHLQGQKNAKLSYIQSLNYYLAVDNNSVTSHPVELNQKVESVLQNIGIENLGTNTLWDLYGHFEKERDFTQAEGMLMGLAALTDSRADALAETKCFYQRLLALSPAELTAGGLSREQIQQKLNDLA